MSIYTKAPSGSLSSPVKKGSASLIYQTAPLPKAGETRKLMMREMVGSWIGPMPVEEFLTEFLPRATRRSPRNSGLFAALKNQKRETDMYAPFITLIHENSLIPGFKMVDTSNHPDINSRQGKKIKPDPSMYRVDVETAGNVTQFEKLELNFEFKLHDVNDPFRDPEPTVINRTDLEFESDTDSGKEVRGQLASYATEWCSRQHRTFAYTIFILGSKARFIRWDRSGAIVTEMFDYKENSQPLIDFLWRFVHLDDAGRGRDKNVREADPEEVSLARQHLVRWAPSYNRPFVVFTIEDSGKSHEYIGWGSMADADSLIGRATRAYPVYEKTTGKIRFLKNAWRALDLEKEADVIRKMNVAEVRNVPKVISGGDIEDHVTVSHKYQDRSWRCGTQELTGRINHMFTTDFVGQTLEKFTSTKQLTKAVHDAFLAHWDATEKCGFLHRDVSAGNVMMADSGDGILNDWDLVKRIVRPPQIELPRNHTRTGTWQFLSYKNLKIHGRMHLIQDDMESFVYILLYHALRYARSSAFEELSQVMQSIFDNCTYNIRTRRYTGGDGKRLLCLDPPGVLGPNFCFVKNKPLTRLVSLLLSAVRQWHDFERNWHTAKEPGPDPDLDTDLVDVEDPIPLNLDTVTFKNHFKLAEEFVLALASPAWPTDDSAVDQLPEEEAPKASSKRTRNEDVGIADDLPSHKKMKSTGGRNPQGKGSSRRHAT